MYLYKKKHFNLVLNKYLWDLLFLFFERWKSYFHATTGLKHEALYVRLLLSSMMEYKTFSVAINYSVTWQTLEANVFKYGLKARRTAAPKGRRIPMMDPTTTNFLPTEFASCYRVLHRDAGSWNSRGQSLLQLKQQKSGAHPRGEPWGEPQKSRVLLCRLLTKSPLKICTCKAIRPKDGNHQQPREAERSRQ